MVVLEVVQLVAKEEVEAVLARLGPSLHGRNCRFLCGWLRIKLHFTRLRQNLTLCFELLFDVRGDPLKVLQEAALRQEPAAQWVFFCTLAPESGSLSECSHCQGLPLIDACVNWSCSAGLVRGSGWTFLVHTGTVFCLSKGLQARMVFSLPA